MKRKKTETIIIGAGIYGIATANYLYHKKLPFEIVGRFMDLWRNHTFDSMILRSDFSTSEIPHPENRYSADNFFREYPELEWYRNTHLPIGIYRQYLNWVEDNLEYPVLDDLVENLELATDFSMHHALYVEVIEYSEHKFCAILKRRKNDLVIFAKNVIIATGQGAHMSIPEHLTENPLKVHTYNTRKIESLSKKKVLVIGGGQSAAESIEVLKEKNEVVWNSRHTPIYLEQPVKIPSWLFNLIVNSAPTFHILPPFLRKHLLKILSRPTIRPVFKSMLHATKTTTSIGEVGRDKQTGLIYDAIVTATGYTYDLDNLAFLSKNIKSEIQTDEKIPILDHAFRSTCPRLFFAGGISSLCFGSSLRFIIGSNFAAETISKGLLES